MDVMVKEVETEKYKKRVDTLIAMDGEGKNLIVHGNIYIIAAGSHSTEIGKFFDVDIPVVGVRGETLNVSLPEGVSAGTSAVHIADKLIDVIPVGDNMVQISTGHDYWPLYELMGSAKHLAAN